MEKSFHTTIVGNYGFSNYGDDILLRSILSSLQGKVPEGELCVLINESDYLQAWYPEVIFKPSNQFGKIKTKYLIYGGGTQFYSFKSDLYWLRKRLTNIGHYLLEPKKLFERLKIAACDNNIYAERTGAISIGVGPFIRGSSAESEAKSILKRTEFLSVRDLSSLHLLESWGISGVKINSDLGFAMELWLDKPLKHPTILKETGRIGVIIRNWPHTEEGMRYIDPLFHTMAQLRTEGLHPEFISFAGDYDIKVRNFLEEKGESVLNWDPYKQTPASFTEELMVFDIILTTRAHGVVIGSGLGIPTIAVEIEPKLKAIREGLDIGTIGWGPPFDPNELLQIIHNLISNRENIIKDMRKFVENCASSAFASMNELRYWLDL